MSKLLDSGRMADMFGPMGKKLPENVFQRNVLLEKTGHETKTEEQERLSKVIGRRAFSFEDLRKSISEKWEKSGFLNGLTGSTKFKTEGTDFSSSLWKKLPDNVFTREVLLEKTGHRTKTERDEQFILPMVKRVSATTIANDIISVQPLDLPTGILFY